MKKTLLRMCVITHEHLPLGSLLRIVKDNQLEVHIDLEKRIEGRGAYIKKDKQIIEIAKKKKALDKALKTSVPESIYDELMKLA